MDTQLNRWYTICSTEGAKPVWLPNIIAVVGDGSSVVFYIKDESKQEGFYKLGIGKNLKKFENTIHADFGRVNQKHLVNLHYVDRIQNIVVYLKEPLGWQVKLTDAYRMAFKALIRM